MNPKIQRLLDWAAIHSSKTRQLHQFITDYMQAASTDIRTLTDYLQATRNDRDSLAKISRKLYGKWAVETNVELQQGLEPMTDDEYRLYAAACINQMVAEQGVVRLEPVAAEKKIKEIAECAFNQVSLLGCPLGVIGDMRKHFLGTLQVEPVEDKAVST